MKPLGALRVTAILLIAGLSPLLATCGEWKAPRLQWLSLHPPAEQPATGGDGSRQGLPSVLELDELVGTASKGVRQGGQVVSFGADYDPGISDTTSGREEAIEVEDTSLNLRAYEVGDYTYAIIPQLVGDGGYGGGRDDDIPLLSLFSTEVCDYGGGRDDDIPLLYYLGVADYTYGSWRWYGPFTTTNPEITLNSDDLESRFKSPTDMLYLAVLTTAAGKETSQLPREGLAAALPFEPSPRTVSQLEDPVGVRVNVVTTDVDSGIGTLPQIVTGLEAVVGASSITLTWDDNPDPHVTMHQVFRENLTLGEAVEPLADVPMPTLAYEDTTAVVDTTYRYFVQAVNDVGPGGMASVTAGIGVNSPPVADLFATPTEGDAPLTVDFDASGSYDMDGSIVKFEWDWEGDGLYDFDSGVVAMVQHDYDTVGTYDATVRVTDNQGATHTDTATIIVSSASGWYVVTPDSVGIVGGYTSLAVVNGNPAIGYYDASNGDLRYVRATDGTGTSWGAPVTIDESGDVGYYISLSVVNGNPAISYYDDSSGTVKYARATDSDGSSWGTPVVVDDLGTGSGTFYISTSLTVVNGNPAISYFNDSAGTVMYVRSNDANGDSWDSPVIVDYPDLAITLFTSLAVVDGNPAVCYTYEMASDLVISRAVDGIGTSWSPRVSADSVSDVSCGSLEIIGGYPAIGYSGLSGDVMYVQATDVDGSAWGSPVLVDATGSEVWYVSLAMINGNPAMSYYDYTDFDLMYSRSLDMQGASWEAPTAVDSVGDVGACASLADVNGSPAISYLDAANGDLKYAYFLP